jgi:cell division protein FtsB
MSARDLQDPTEPSPAPTALRSSKPSRRLYGNVEARERWRKLLRYALGAGAVVLLANAVIGETGYLASLRAQRDRDDIVAQVAKLHSDNQQLSEQAKRLKDDPAALEDAIRRELGLVREGETLVIVRDGKPAGK